MYRVRRSFREGDKAINTKQKQKKAPSAKTGTKTKRGDESSFGSSLSRKACGSVRAEPSHQGTKLGLTAKSGE